jgi:glycosyltransferase involved in cell wall biosynthesis
MRVSVILSTYNAAPWLEKAILGYACQTHRNFELLVADDGSTDETAACIERLRRETGLALRHVWHADRGFRKCTILNKAVAASSADYLVFSDGDCIPRRDFLAAHITLAKPGRFLSGGTVRLPLPLSQRITAHDVLGGRATGPAWLLAHGLGWNKRLRMLTCGLGLAAFLDAVTTTRATWNGCNASGWKADLLRVNGFDERMEWGGEDRELGERLVNAGVRGRQVRHRAVCVHLDHARPYVRTEALAFNRAIREETRRSRSTWTPYGIEQPLRIFDAPAVATPAPAEPLRRAA